MILIDFSQTVIANAWIQCVTGNPTALLDRNRLHQSVLASIRKIKAEHDFGEVVLACESDHYWRRDFFPYYKATRDKSSRFWADVLSAEDQLAEEFRTYFKVIKVDGCEADDVIGVLTSEVAQLHKPVLIVSADEDFYQLQRYANVKQWKSVTKVFLTCDDPIQFLAEHIIRGDPGDGIPNILSPDDSFVTHTRQKAIRKKDLEKLRHIRSAYYIRNQTLIDFQLIPTRIQESILKEYLKCLSL